MSMLVPDLAPTRSSSTARPVVAPPPANPSCGLAATALAVVDYLSEMVPLRCWAVTRLRDGRQVLVASRTLGSEAPDPECMVSDWSTTLAVRSVRGAAPVVAPDAMSVAAYAEAAASRDRPVGAFVAVPIPHHGTEGGDPLGMLVGLDPEPLDGNLRSYLPLFHLLAELLAHAAEHGDGSLPPRAKRTGIAAPPPPAP